MAENENSLKFAKEFPGKVLGQFTSLDAHVSKLDSRVGTLETSMAELGATTRAVLSEIKSQNVQIGTLATTVHKGTPWPTLIGSGSLILAIVTVIGSQAIAPIRESVSRIEEIAKENNATFQVHVRDGHPQRVEQAVTALDTRITEVEGNRYSENDSSQNVQIAYLTAELERLRSTAPDVRIEFLEKEVDKLRAMAYPNDKP